MAGAGRPERGGPASPSWWPAHFWPSRGGGRPGASPRPGAAGTSGRAPCEAAAPTHWRPLTGAEQGSPAGQQQQQPRPQHGAWRSGHRRTRPLLPLTPGRLAAPVHPSSGLDALYRGLALAEPPAPLPATCSGGQTGSRRCFIRTWASWKDPGAAAAPLSRTSAGLARFPLAPGGDCQGPV